MKTLLSLLLLPLLLNSQTFQWARFPGNVNLSCGVGIATDANGNCYTQGLNGIMKYDAAGNGKLFWKGNFQNGNIECIYADTEGNLYIAGSYGGEVVFDKTIRLKSRGNNVMDIFIAKINSAGICQWAKTASGGDVIFQFSVINRIVADGSGNCYVAGKLDDQISFGNNTLKSNGRYDFFVGKYDTNGNLLWIKQLSSDNDDMGEFIYGITNDIQGNCYITGVLGGATGQQENYNLTKGAYAMKFNTDGKCLWAVSLVTIDSNNVLGPCLPQGIGTDASGNSYITGYFLGKDLYDGRGTPFLIKMDAGGKIIWTKYLKGHSLDAATAKSIVVDKTGNSYIAGAFTATLYTPKIKLTSYGKEDLFIAMFDTNGELKWISKSGGPEKESADLICLDKSGNVYVSGDIASNAARFNSTAINNISAGINCASSPCSGPFVAKFKTEK